MSDWETRNLGDIARIEIGGTPSRNEPSYWASDSENGFPWVAISDIGPRYVTDTAEQITGKGVQASNTKLVPAGTVLMSFKLTIGRTSFAGTDLFTNEAIAAFHITDGSVDPTFLYYMLPRAASGAVADTAIKGATLNKAKLKRLSLPLPPSPQQRKIAKILTTVDNLIEKTESLIAKYQAVKQGMMHDLFTRGVDEHGHLRPTYDEAPELYKESELGWIPKEWEVVLLGRCLCQTPRNGIYKPPSQIGHGTLMVGQTSIDDHRRLDLLIGRRAQVSESELNYYGLEQHDVLVVRVFATLDGVGLPALAERLSEPCVYESNMLRLRFTESFMLPVIAFHQMILPDFRCRVQAIANASTQCSINQRELCALRLRRPPHGEQSAIQLRIQSFERSIGKQIEVLTKLEQEKTGLMQDLLTGTVRVNTAETEPPA